jgi:NhaP-type Na+/H+ or K+/H+ antiporter
MQAPVSIAATVLGLGVGAQWLAWRYQIPAIVLLAVGGILVGPATGVFNPHADLGPGLQPFIAIAVAIILFEGGISLSFRELQSTSTASGVLRLTLVGAPVGWVLGALAAHFIAGLEWSTAAVLGGIMVVTGPTVIAPLLRQAHLARSPAVTLKWEGIVNDPIGALFAVLAYEFALRLGPDQPGSRVFSALGYVAGGALFGAFVGVAVGLVLAASYRRGKVPEFLKGPLLIGAVLACFAGANAFVEETGLVAVTVLGVTLGNSKIASLEEIRRLKEVLATVLVSAVFVILTATLDRQTLAALDMRSVGYVLAILFVVRPATVFSSLYGSKVPWKERLLLAWIAPRGIVAVAIAGLFGAKLIKAGFADGDMLVPLSFAVVLSTVVAHGFSLRPVARALRLTSEDGPAILLVGGNDFTVGFAQALKAAEVPVIIADRSWSRLRKARHAGLPTYHGEVLSEATEHHLELSSVGFLLAASDNDDYNSLVCTDLGPEIGRSHVFQLGRSDDPKKERHSHELGGRTPHALRPGFFGLNQRLAEGWKFSRTRITEQYTKDKYAEKRPDGSAVVLVIRANGQLEFPTSDPVPSLSRGDQVIALGPAPAKQPAVKESNTPSPAAQAPLPDGSTPGAPVSAS